MNKVPNQFKREYEKKIKYYIFEIEMPEEYEAQLRQIAEKEHITLDKLTVMSLLHITENTDDVIRWKSEFDSLPVSIKEELERIKVVRIYPVYEDETDDDAQNRVIEKETKQVLQLHEISQKEFLDYIEEDDFFQLFGNPVIINCDNGQKLVCMAWPMAERLMRITGRGAEADEVIRKAAEKECFDGEE